MKQVKVSFRRRKRADGSSVIKVYTTQRLKDFKYPKNLHLAYISDNEWISQHSKSKVVEALRAKWRLYHSHDDVTVDWENAETKWSKRGQRKQRSVDRSQALIQIRTWLTKEQEIVMPHFGGWRTLKESSLTRELFFVEFNDLSYRIGSSLIRYDPVDIANWWDYLEAPRLLYRYYAYIINKGKSFSFGRLGYLSYLRENIRRGYAAKEFMRTQMCNNLVRLRLY